VQQLEAQLEEQRVLRLEGQPVQRLEAQRVLRLEEQRVQQLEAQRELRQLERLLPVNLNLIR
jgi:hypothetical protein